MESKIRVRGLSVQLREKSILEDINFDLLLGENLCIIGKSGEGKSVLLKSILGLIHRNSGTVVINNEEIKENVAENTKKHNLAISFQNDCLFDSMTILENLCFPLINRNGINKKGAAKLSEEILSRIALPTSTLALYPSALSGGMKKRIAIARTIITKPDVVFFDEPTTGLDPVTSAKILDIIEDYTSQEHVSSITVTHSLQCARRISDKIAMLHSGRIAWYGPTSSIDTAEDIHMRNFLLYS